MTVEDRLGRIENTVDKLVALQEDIVEILRNQQALLESQQAVLEEMRQDNAYTRKLWVAVARKLNLFDDLQDADD